MNQFVGQRVSLSLADDTVLLGNIADVDEARQVLRLSGASSTNEVNGKKEIMVFPGLLEVLAADIVNIDFVHEEPPPRPSTPHSPAVSVKSNSRKKTDWTNDDIRKIKQEEFDFQSNLKLFNKQQIFSEIKSQDKTDVQERLVSHNLSGRGQEKRQENLQRKLLPSENVLDSTDKEDCDRIMNLSPLQRSLSVVSSASLSSISAHLVTAIQSISVRLYDDAQVKKEELYRPIFPFVYLIVENGGKSTASHIQTHYSQAKEVIIALGPNFRLNAIALSAARHLASKGLLIVLENVRGGSEEELFASVYRDQHAALTALYPTLIKKTVKNPSNSVLISSGTKTASGPTVYFEFCPQKPSQSTSLFFDPYILPSVLTSTSRIFLMDSGIPADLLAIPTDRLFKETFEVQLLKP